MSVEAPNWPHGIMDDNVHCPCRLPTGPYCDEKSPKGNECTLEKGHDGDHVACGMFTDPTNGGTMFFHNEEAWSK